MKTKIRGGKSRQIIKNRPTRGEPEPSVCLSSEFPGSTYQEYGKEDITSNRGDGGQLGRYLSGRKVFKNQHLEKQKCGGNEKNKRQGKP